MGAGNEDDVVESKKRNAKKAPKLASNGTKKNDEDHTGTKDSWVVYFDFQRTRFSREENFNLYRILISMYFIAIGGCYSESSLYSLLQPGFIKWLNQLTCGMFWNYSTLILEY